MRGWMATAALIGSGGCGGPGHGGAGTGGEAGFDCKDRMAGYVAHGTLGAEEVGVALDCRERGPRLVRWRVESDGTRAEDALGMSTGQFEALWQKIDDSGWRDLQDCAAGDEHDPVYLFTFKDWNSAASFQCQNLDPPYPYHTILDELNAAATSGRGQLGPDVPAPDEQNPAKPGGRR
jgi:hypothetical protein